MEDQAEHLFFRIPPVIPCPFELGTEEGKPVPKTNVCFLFGCIKARKWWTLILNRNEKRRKTN